MSGNETQFVVTCDFDWEGHGGDKSFTPTDVFSLAEAKRVGAAHAREFPTHTTCRIWKFDRRYIANRGRKASSAGQTEEK